jgi:hypothetical protein
MDYSPVLENKRVLLRPLQASDLEALLEVALEPSLWELGLTRVSNREELEKYMGTGDEHPFCGDR